MENIYSHNWIRNYVQVEWCQNGDSLSPLSCYTDYQAKKYMNRSVTEEGYRIFYNIFCTASPRSKCYKWQKYIYN